jgi:hypothetical protein
VPRSRLSDEGEGKAESVHKQGEERQSQKDVMFLHGVYGPPIAARNHKVPQIIAATAAARPMKKRWPW